MDSLRVDTWTVFSNSDNNELHQALIPKILLWKCSMLTKAVSQTYGACCCSFYYLCRYIFNVIAYSMSLQYIVTSSEKIVMASCGQHRKTWKSIMISLDGQLALLFICW